MTLPPPEDLSQSRVLLIPDITSIDIRGDEVQGHRSRFDAGELTTVRLGAPFMTRLGSNLSHYVDSLPEEDVLRREAVQLVDFETLAEAGKSTHDILFPDVDKGHFYWSRVLHFLAATSELDFIEDPEEQFQRPITLIRVNGRKTFSREGIMKGEGSGDDTIIIDNDVTTPLYTELSQVMNPDTDDTRDPQVIRMKFFAERLMALENWFMKERVSYLASHTIL